MENEINQLAHPYVHLIPYAIWDDLFNSAITDNELKFLTDDLDTIKGFADEVFQDPDEDEFKLWLCILLGHKDKTADELAEFGWNLEIEDVILWKAACVANRADLLQLMFDHFEDKAEMLSNLISEDDYYDFRYAAQTGNVDVLEWVKQVTDANTLTTMIKNNNFYAFRVAAEFERIEILDWLRKQVPDDVFESIDLRTVMQSFKSPIKNRPSLLEWLRKEELKRFQVVPTFFAPTSVTKRPASDLMETELGGNSSPVLGNKVI